MSTVNIYFGENGEGKTNHLKTIICNNIDNRIDTLAVCNSIFSRFRRTDSEHYKYFGIKRGTLNVGSYIKEHLAQLYYFDKKNRMASIFEYAGFSPKIKLNFKIKKNRTWFFNKFVSDKDNPIDYDLIKFENISFLIERGVSIDLINNYYNFIEDDSSFENYLTNERYRQSHYSLGINKKTDKMITIDLVSNDFIHNPLGRPEFLSLLLLSEKYLKKMGILSAIDIYIQKHDEWFNLNDASSGEKYFLGLMSFIGSNVEAGTVIVIDEPENSLHPKWQKEYISMLLDLTFYYGTEIFIATHSPIIASSTDKNVNLYKMKDFEPIREQNKFKNIEKIYMEYFEVITPENRTLSKICEKLLNDYSVKKIKLTDAKDKINSLIEISYDDRQKEFLKGVSKILNDIK